MLAQGFVVSFYLILADSLWLMYSISNLGMYQVEHFAAIINPPQVLPPLTEHRILIATFYFGCSESKGIFFNLFLWHLGMHTRGGQGCTEGDLG